MTATFYVGDAVTVMNTLPEKSVDLILTSPPFLALRSYLPQDHPDKALEGGSQATPGAYIDWLLDVVEACARVLAPHGSLCFELGDTYAGSVPGGNRSGWHRSGQADQERVGQRYRQDGYAADSDSNGGTGWPLAKSLSLIPETFRFAMVYGHNPHTGRTTEPWRLRNVIRWVRPNPPVGALGDKFRPATSELMVFCKAKDRFFDLDAVREPHKSGDHHLQYPMSDYGQMKGRIGETRDKYVGSINPAGAPPLDWWNIPLLDGEKETLYGPKPPKDRTHEVSKVGKKAKAREGQGGDWSRGSEGLVFRNPDGAPPLDWWNIPSDAQVRTLNYVECGCTEACMTDEVPDQFQPATSELLVFCKSKTRYFDLDAVREPAQAGKDGSANNVKYGGIDYRDESIRFAERVNSNPVGAPPLDWWNIPPGGYPGAHYAVWPPELLVKPIKAMCPEKVCRRCGEPRRRISGEAEYVPSASYRGGHTNLTESARVAPGVNQFVSDGQGKASLIRQAPTLGFSDCLHDDYRPGIVLDPFAGSGTTLAVATGHGRDAIGIDLDERNYELALDRVGPLVLTRAA